MKTELSRSGRCPLVGGSVYVSSSSSSSLPGTEGFLRGQSTWSFPRTRRQEVSMAPTYRVFQQRRLRMNGQITHRRKNRRILGGGREGQKKEDGDGREYITQES